MILLIICILQLASVCLLSYAVYGLNKRVYELEMEPRPVYKNYEKEKYQSRLEENIFNLNNLELKIRNMIVENILQNISTAEQCCQKLGIHFKLILLTLKWKDKDGNLTTHTVEANNFYECGVFTKIYVLENIYNIVSYDINFEFGFK